MLSGPSGDADEGEQMSASAEHAAVGIESFSSGSGAAVAGGSPTDGGG
jgi:hypothetical protein